MSVPHSTNSAAIQRILAVLEQKSNMSISDISAEAFVGMSTLAFGGYIRALKNQKLIYVSGWRKVKGRFSTPLFAPGNMDDVPRPKVDEKNRDAPGMHRILETLERYGTLTYREIAEFSGLSPHTVKNSGFLNALIAQNRIHIGGWRRSRNGPMSPVYCSGQGSPMEKPQPMTGVEKCRRHRIRAKVSEQGVGLALQMTLLAASIQSQSGNFSFSRS